MYGDIVNIGDAVPGPSPVSVTDGPPELATEGPDVVLVVFVSIVSEWLWVSSAMVWECDPPEIFTLDQLAVVPDVVPPPLSASPQKFLETVWPCAPLLEISPWSC